MERSPREARRGLLSSSTTGESASAHPSDPCADSGGGGSSTRAASPSLLPAETERKEKKTFEKKTVLAPKPTEMGPVATRAKSISRRKKRDVAAGLKKEVAGFADRLDPSTFELWLLIARARTAGMREEQVAEATEIDPEVIATITKSPTYMGFEATYRRVQVATPELELAAQRLVRMLPLALAAEEHWVQQRDPNLAQVSLRAAAQIKASVGIDTERKRINKSVVRIDLTDEFIRRVKEANVLED